MPELKIYNDTLEPNLWDKDQKLKPDVILRLLRIVKDFYKSTEFKSQILDILLLGSSVNYNWTPESDLDVHIVIDIKKEGLDPEHYRNYLDCIGGKWNQEHDIKIHGHKVEMYVQDITEKNSTIEKARKHASMYSLLSKEWMIPPKKEKIVLDKDAIKEKFYELKNQIDKIIQEKNVDGLKTLMKSIRAYRNKGLEGVGGEFSTENIVFKALRHTGMLEKLKDAVNDIYDRLVSIKESKSFFEKITTINPESLDNIIDETINHIQEHDTPFDVIGLIDDDLSITSSKKGSITDLYKMSYSIDPNSAIEWKYLSDVNKLIWTQPPSEDQLEAVLQELREEYDIYKPHVNVMECIAEDFHLEYRHKNSINEVLDKSSDFYLGWVKRDSLKVIGVDIDASDDNSTHYNVLLGLAPEWRGEPDSNLIRWRYRRDVNSVYWWSFNRPTENEKQVVEKWLADNLGVVTHNHRMMYVPGDSEETGEDRIKAHGKDLYEQNENRSISVVAYHGTNKDFTELTPQDQHPSHILPFGIHFSEDESVARRYGNRVIKVKLSFKKLYDATQEPDDIAKEIAGRRYREGMTSAECLDAVGLARGPYNTHLAEFLLDRYGYDGVRYKDNKSNSINYIVFDKNQVEYI